MYFYAYFYNHVLRFEIILLDTITMWYILVAEFWGNKTESLKNEPQVWLKHENRKKFVR